MILPELSIFPSRESRATGAIAALSLFPQLPSDEASLFGTFDLRRPFFQNTTLAQQKPKP